MAGNTNLHAANKAKKDEFYTRMEDICNELKHYSEHFKGKTVFCNCDDPYESNFFKYFVLNFNSLGLKKLICTCYDGSTVADSQLQLFEPQAPYGNPPISKTRVPHKIVITEVSDLNDDGAINMLDVDILLKSDNNVLTRLQGNGSFDSPECVELLKEADIVVTNPPFSLFRDYVKQLVKYKKKFLIIGHQNAITYKDCFSLIKNNLMWLGYGFKGNAGHFYSIYEDVATASNHKEGMIRVSGVTWFTNLDHQKRHEPLDLYETYSPEKYPHYENYDAIEVSKTAEIPKDYDGYMGVPITFMDKYCPEQFEIIWTTDRGGDGMLNDIRKNHTRYDAPVVNGKGLYKRIIIKRKK